LENSVPFKRAALPNLSSRQYRIAQGFDSAAALLTGDGVRAAAAEERFTGEKATGAFPVNAIGYCLQASGLTPSDIDFVAHGFSYEPFREFYAQDEFLKKQFAEVYSLEAQLQSIRKHLNAWGWDEKYIPVPHHLAHAASAFYVSGFNDSLILVSDGMGEFHSATVAVGTGNDIQIIKQLPAMHSLGILYGVFTLYLGFYMGLDEYKVMGLAPYGNSRRYFSELMGLVQLKEGGFYTIPVLSQNATLTEKETYEGTLRVLADLFGPAREPDAEIDQRHMDLAAALQATLQTALLHVLQHFKTETGQKNLCMAGGVALNCSANGVLKRSRVFKEIFVQPASGDDGTALGAGLYVQRHKDGDSPRWKMSVPLWGPEYADAEIAAALESRPDCASVFFPSFDELVKVVASRLAQGQIIGWFQGRMEFGPRALGSRSILADPRDPTMRDRINALVKKREEFRPFAPAVSAEAATQYFDIRPGEEPTYAHMLFVTHVRKEFQRQLPAITHVDGSARVQTVAREEQPRFWPLLEAFAQLSGMPIILNTSFNVRGQPIVRTPVQAIDTFLAAQLDLLVIGNYLVQRRSVYSNGAARSATPLSV
jgi:carbamoyltransferase